MIPDKLRTVSLLPGTSVLPLLKSESVEKLVPLLTSSLACVGFVTEGNLHHFRSSKHFNYSKMGRVRILKIKGQDTNKLLESFSIELQERGVASCGRGYVTVFPVSGSQPVGEIDRGIVEFIGAKVSHIVLIGFVGRERNCQVWMGRRAATTIVNPAKLQPLLSFEAGSISFTREKVAEVAYKTLGLQPDLYSRLRSAGITSTMLRVDRGIRRFSIHAYELDLTDYSCFIPKASQAIETFEAMPINTVLDSCHAGMVGSPEMVAIIGFCLRHGIITPETDEHFDSVNQALSFDISDLFPLREEGLFSF